MSQKYSELLAETYAEQRDALTSTDNEVFTYIKNIDVNAKDILDLGCGDGRYSKRFIELGARKVIGIDNSEKMISLAYSESIDESVEFLVSDCSELPLADDSIDIVFSNFLLHHLDEFEPTFKEVLRVLKPGGFFIATFSAYVIGQRRDLLCTEIVIRLGDTLTVTNIIHEQNEACVVAEDLGFKILDYRALSNPDAAIDPTYLYKEEVSKLTMFMSAQKA